MINYLKNLINLFQFIDIFCTEDLDPEVIDYTTRPFLEASEQETSFSCEYEATESNISPSSAENDVTFTCRSSLTHAAPPEITYTIASETSGQETSFLCDYEATESNISSSSGSLTPSRPILNETFTFTSSENVAPNMTSTPTVASPTTSRPLNETFCCSSSWQNERLISDFNFIDGISYDYDYDDEVFADNSYLPSPVPEGELPFPRMQKN